MRQFMQSLVVGVALVALAACGGGDSGGGDKPAGGGDKPAESGGGGAAPAGKAYSAADHKGAISGTIKFTGDKPEARTLQMGTSDPVCAGAHADGPALDERFIVNDDMTVPNVFVFIKKGPAGFDFAPPADRNFTINQHGCLYVPHVFGVMKGEEFSVKNDDATLHNVKITSKRNGTHNKSQTEGKSDSWTFEKKETAIPFACDVHKWMGAWAFVLDHPFFAVTGADGKFSLAGVPDGEYELVAWHETFADGKGKSAKVTVASGAIVQDFELSK